MGEWRERTTDKDDIREMGEFVEKMREEGKSRLRTVLKEKKRQSKD